MNEVFTNWTKATTNPNEAMIGLISCLESGKNAWIEIRKNGTQNNPIQKKNPLLDNPLNWTMSYGTPTNNHTLDNHKFFNETEEDLTKNWAACFGEPEAIQQYQKHGIISSGLFVGTGVCHPVRREDFEKYRSSIDGYKCGGWTTFWKPKDGIPYWIVDADIDEVFTVCYTNEPVDKVKAMEQAGTFLLEYAKKKKEQEQDKIKKETEI